jgi:hypothetical protein
MLAPTINSNKNEAEGSPPRCWDKASMKQIGGDSATGDAISHSPVDCRV